MTDQVTFADYQESPPVPPSDDFDELDDDFAPRPRQRLGKATAVLAALVLIGAGVLGGIEINKHEGSSSATTGGFAGAGGAGGAARGEGFAGGGGFGGAAGTGGTGTTGTGGTGTTGTATTPVVVGTVVSASSTALVVKNLGGTQVTVKLTTTTTVTKALGATDLAAGQTVSVYGTTATDSSVTATNVIIR